MKRFVAVILTFALMCSLLPVVFAASDKANEAAQALYDLGLFQGTGDNDDGTPNFDLDHAPTRAEAVTMLVRLLGKEEEAKAGNWVTPFADVADWAKPYVGYAYNNGLTTGTSATTFGGEQTVNAAQYLTFILRSLGYESGKDFRWNEPWELSQKIGLTNGDYTANTTSFTRGDVAVVSHNALSVKREKGTPDLYTGNSICNVKIGDKLYDFSPSKNIYTTTYSCPVYYAKDGTPCVTPWVFGLLIDLLSGNYTIVSDKLSSSEFIDGTLVLENEKVRTEVKETEIAPGIYTYDVKITYDGATATMEYSYAKQSEKIESIKKSTGLSCQVALGYEGDYLTVFWMDDLVDFFEITDPDLISRLYNIRFETIGSYSFLVLE